jgi:hypothetical protein
MAEFLRILGFLSELAIVYLFAAAIANDMMGDDVLPTFLEIKR